jgi:hypothetical protein
MIEVYETVRWNNDITRKEYVRETERFYFNAAGGRTAKSTEYCRHHPTREAAHAFLVERATRALVAAQEHVTRCEAELAQVRAMKPED